MTAESAGPRRDGGPRWLVLLALVACKDRDSADSAPVPECNEDVVLDDLQVRTTAGVFQGMRSGAGSAWSGVVPYRPSEPGPDAQARRSVIMRGSVRRDQFSAAAANIEP